MTATFHVRIANCVPDSSALDILVDGYPVLTGLRFGDVNDYTEHEANEYTVAVTESGDDEPLVDEPVAFESDTHYTILLLETMADVSIRVLEDGA